MNNKYVRKVVVVFIGFLLVFSNLSTDALRAEERVLKTLTATLETMEVELSYDEGSIPEGSQLQVVASTPEVTESMKNAAASLVEGTVIEANAYDVSVNDAEGNKVTPASPVTVTFKNINMNAISNVFMQQDEAVLDTEAEIIEKNATVITKSLSNFLFMNVEQPQAEEPVVEDPVVEVNEAEKMETKQASALSANLLGADISGSPVSFGFDLSLNNKGSYYLQIRVYDSSDNSLLQTLPQTDLYRFNKDELTVSLSYASNYSVDGAYFNSINGNYNQNSVKSKDTKKTIKNNKVDLDLKNRGKYSYTNRTNYLDIYVTKETPKVDGSLNIISELETSNLSAEDSAFEQKKSYNYQIIEADTGAVLTGLFKYELYDLDNKLIASSLITKTDGIFQIRADRKAKIDLSSLDVKDGSKYIVKQVNGDRYETTYSINNGTDSSGKQTTPIQLVKMDTTIKFVNKRMEVSEIVSWDKTANILNWNDRTYSIDLLAGYQSNEKTVKENADLYFVLDVSGSMTFTDAAVEGSGTDGKPTIGDLDPNYIYFSKSYIESENTNYGYGVSIDNTIIKNKLDNAKNDGKYKGIQTVKGNKIIFYNGSKWQYLVVDDGVKSNNSYRYYVEKDKKGTEIAYDLKESDLKDGVYTQRSSILITSVNEFIEGMSDNCRVGIVTFGTSGAIVKSLTSLNSTENRKNVRDAVNRCYGTYGNGTYMSTGLAKLKEDNAFVSSMNQKYIIAFTDGADSGTNAALSEAEALKESSTIFTIGVGNTNETFLTKIASTPDNSLNSSSISEIYDLLEIISDQIGNAYFRGTMIDYIDPRFDLVDKSGSKLNLGDKVIDSNNSNIIGTVEQDENGVYVKWTNQVVKTNTSSSEFTWKATLNLKAKEDFLGGNVILTNQAGSNLTTSLSNKDILNFPMPSVNVKELSFSIENDQTEIEIGDAIAPTEYIKKLNGSISLTGLQLTDAEIQTLISSENKTLTKDYSYSNDKVGKLVYKLESITDGVDSVKWSNHNATHSSKSKDGAKVPVETYKLTVTYEPISVGERNVAADTMPAIDKVCSTIAATGTYEVYVKGGPEVALNKTADQTTTNDDRSFTINLTASSKEVSNEESVTPVDVVLILDRSGSMRNSKISTLNSSVKKLIDDLKVLSPESRIGIVSYNHSATDVTKGFQNVQGYNYSNLYADGNTNMGSAMKIAYENYFNKDYFNQEENKTRKQIIIAFTDGENNAGGDVPFSYFPKVIVPDEVPKLTEEEKKILKAPYPAGDYTASHDEPAVRFAKSFKNDGVEIYSIGLGKDTSKAENFLKMIASTPSSDYYANPQTTADLSDIFEALTQTITTKSPLFGVAISDTITKEFRITDAEKNRLIEDGATVTLNNDGTTTITWENQTILYAENDAIGWEKHINVVAKDDFLGGNYAPTNTEATLTYDKYEYEFPKPTVNVGLLDITLDNDDHLVFKGTQISPIDCINELNTSINIASLKLTDEEIAKLVNDGAYTRSQYIYKNDSNFGKIVYTLTKTGVDTFEDHVANTESAVDNAGRLPVETYQLKVEYVALTVEERIEYLKEQKVDLTAYTDPTNDSKTSIYGSGVHQIYVASGELDITKTIDQQYTTEGKVNANQSFVFKITKKDLKGNVVDTFYQTISFSANETKTTKSVKIKGLDAGYYTVEEVQDWSWKYKLGKVSDNYSKNKVDNEDIYIGDTIDKKLFGVEEGFKIDDIDYSSPAKSTFNNVKVTTGPISQIISDVASAINTFNN